MTTGTNTKKIIRQIEYYFGDSNIQRDKFLQDEIAKDSEGWVPLTTMLKFKRLGDLVEGDGARIVTALKGAEGDLVQVAEDESKIRRNPELKVPECDDNYKRLQKARTCYVKGFGVEETLDDLQDFFDKYGTESVYMRRVPLSKQFKGSVFVTFKTQKNCDDFMNEAETKYKEADLIKLTKAAYYEQKKEEKNPGRTQKKNAAAERADRDEGALERIIKFTGVTDDTVGREEIVEKIGKDEVDFTCFERGKSDGLLMLKGGRVAKEAVEKMETNPVQIKGAEKVEFVALEGDDAAKAFQQVKDEREALFARLKNKKGGKGGKFGGKGGNYNRKGGKSKNTKITFNDDEDSAKKTPEEKENTKIKFGGEDEGPAEKKAKVEA